MKKVIVTMALVLAFGICTSAQQLKNDSFFTDWEDVSNGLDRDTYELPALPGGHGGTGNVSAPLGTGLLILTALGTCYAMTKKHK